MEWEILFLAGAMITVFLRHVVKTEMYMSQTGKKLILPLCFDFSSRKGTKLKEVSLPNVGRVQHIDWDKDNEYLCILQVLTLFAL